MVDRVTGNPRGSSVDQSVLEPNDGVMFRLPPLLRSRSAVENRTVSSLSLTFLLHLILPLHLLYTPLLVDQAAAHSRTALLYLM